MSFRSIRKKSPPKNRKRTSTWVIPEIFVAFTQFARWLWIFPCLFREVLIINKTWASFIKIVWAIFEKKSKTVILATMHFWGNPALLLFLFHQCVTKSYQISWRAASEKKGLYKIWDGISYRGNVIGHAPTSAGGEKERLRNTYYLGCLLEYLSEFFVFPEMFESTIS